MIACIAWLRAFPGLIRELQRQHRLKGPGVAELLESADEAALVAEQLRKELR
jgi:hypothetical protein